MTLRIVKTLKPWIAASLVAAASASQAFSPWPECPEWPTEYDSLNSSVVIIKTDPCWKKPHWDECLRIFGCQPYPKPFPKPWPRPFPMPWIQGN